MTKLAVIRIRGNAAVPKRIDHTLNLLNLRNRNNCVILEDNESNRGMIQKAQNFITFGEIDKETLKLLKEKRGEENSKTFKLSPPKRGFDKGGVRKRHNEGGALGYRGKEINELLRRMI
ncbi:MAG: uL30 family ribosomal protein [Candidatus Undinarchaeales archaeon]